MKVPVFKDRVKVYFHAGDGGSGCIGFRREKFVPFGGPNGGDGGDGASIYIVANPQVHSLLDLYYHPHQRGTHGGPGRTKNRHGKKGQDAFINVPPGTVAIDKDVFGEVLNSGDTLLIVQGGKGGLGNSHFVSSTNQAPRKATPGTPGEQREVWLELKTIADVGLVGYPNAGKSTLLSSLTNARPKIASYPFSTLNPVIGTLQNEAFESLRIADIPGLIEGAHKGAGLGQDFLKHIERSRILLFVIDMAGQDGRNPVDDFINLKNELKHCNKNLLSRLSLIVSNKMDIPEAAQNLELFCKETNERPFEVSAINGDGIDALKNKLWELSG